MQVGDLIWDDYYGQGIIIEIDEAGDHTIRFTEVGKTAFSSISLNVQEI